MIETCQGRKLTLKQDRNPEIIAINMFKAGDTHLLKADTFYTPKASNIQQDSAKIVRHVHMQIEKDPQTHRK